MDRIGEAIAMLDRRDRLERTVLFALKSNPNDFYNAFASISRNTRFIYIHAYQSYVWNRAISERLKRHGHAVLLGDFVVRPDIELEELPEPAEGQDDEALGGGEESEDDKEGAKAKANPEGGNPKKEENKQEEEKEEEEKMEEGEQMIKIGAKKIKYVEITEENIKSYTMEDVIFPIIGH